MMAFSDQYPPGGGQRQQAQPYRELMDALAFPVVYLDSSNCFLWLNHAAEDFFRNSFSILQNSNLDRIIAADSPLFSLIRRARSSGASVEDRAVSFVGPRLGLKTARVQLVPIASRNIAGLPENSLIMTIQEHSVAEQLASQNNFKGAALSMSRMTALLAHEVKNPLAGIKGAAQLLELELDKSQRELSAMIVAEADRITSLLQRIETLSSDMPVRFELVNIHEILDHCLKITTASFGRHLEVRRRYDPSLPDISADRQMLVQCFLNLFKNASEATDKGNVLTVTTSYSLTRYSSSQITAKTLHLPLQIDIADNGSGISEDIRGHIFEPFVSNKSGGSGLGLAMVASVVADHGGAVSVQSRKGATCFTLNLPIAGPAKNNSRKTSQ